MHLFSFSSKNKSERVLILNIGGATVSGAFVARGEGLTKIETVISTDIGVLPDVTSAALEREMEKALSQTVDLLAKARRGAPDRVVVSLQSPWYVSQARTVKMSRPSAFVFSRSMLDDMIARELKSFEDEEIASSVLSGEPLRAIESNILQVKLNGYPTAKPIGLSARELEFSIFLSVSPDRVLKKIKENIGRHFRQKVTFSSFLLAAFLVTRDFFPHQNDYLLIDVGGEITDVSLVRDSVLVRSVSFPKGSNFILRNLSTRLKRSISESISLCALYAEDKVEASIKDACADVLNSAKNEWLEAFQKALFDASSALSIPDTVLLSVPGDIAPWFIDTIRREEFRQRSLTEKEFKVVVLNAELFHESLSFGENVLRDPSIMIEALAAGHQENL